MNFNNIEEDIIIPTVAPMTGRDYINYVNLNVGNYLLKQEKFLWKKFLLGYGARNFLDEHMKPLGEGELFSK